MKTVKTTIYKFSELSKEVKEKVIEKHYEHEDYPFLSDGLTESCKALLDEHKIKYNDLEVMYSLSYCQGDGLCFTGNFSWKKYRVKIIHSERYYYAESVDITVMNKEGEEIDNEDIFNKFKSIYLKICRELKKEGYAEIDYRMNNEEFSELADVNEWFYYQDGSFYVAK